MIQYQNSQATSAGTSISHRLEFTAGDLTERVSSYNSSNHIKTIFIRGLCEAVHLPYLRYCFI